MKKISKLLHARIRPAQIDGFIMRPSRLKPAVCCLTICAKLVGFDEMGLHSLSHPTIKIFFKVQTHQHSRIIWYVTMYGIRLVI